ncbi:MAG: SagB family peptide dehydrogenase [Actinomycetota bacterium]|nr:SagB family peptide dehydrogenase [Actinomycetota bacterium]
MTPLDAGRETSRVRRANGLVAYWEDGDFLLHNYLTDKKTKVSPAVVALLDSFRRPVEDREAEAAFERIGAVEVFEKLLEQDVLVVEDSPLEVEDSSVGTWEWGQDARFFHFSTQHVTYEASGAKQAENLRAHALDVPAPSAFKSVQGSPTVALAEARANPSDSLWDVLGRRRTVREFAREPITLEQLSTILRWTWGATTVVDDPPIGTHLLKTSPSGGARHPVEVYALVLRVEGLDPGLYHYSVATNELELIRSGSFEALAVEICSGQPWVGNCAVVFFMTAVLERSMWKYDHSRAYRVVLMDAGHLGQTFHLVCTCLGLGPLTTAATQDRLLQEVLGIDGTREIPVYAAAVGPRRCDTAGLEATNGFASRPSPSS